MPNQNLKPASGKRLTELNRQGKNPREAMRQASRESRNKPTGAKKPAGSKT